MRLSSLAIFRMNLAVATSRPLRAAEFTSEAVFAGLWAEINTVSGATTSFGPHLNTPLEGIVQTAGYAGAVVRDAFVINSVIQWLGTKEGCVFLNRAQSEAKECDKALLTSWDAINMRKRGLNYGYSALELILHSDPSALRHLWPGDPRFIDPVSERDMAVARATIEWLSTASGRQFVEMAESRIEEQRIREMRAFHQRWNLGAAV